MKLKIGQKYEIKWVDTFSYNGWYSNKELKEKSKEMYQFITSVGIFAGEYFGFIILANHRDLSRSDSYWGHPNWIPKTGVKKIKKL